jgi:hypothetical protein
VKPAAANAVALKFEGAGGINVEFMMPPPFKLKK